MIIETISIIIPIINATTIELNICSFYFLFMYMLS